MRVALVKIKTSLFFYGCVILLQCFDIKMYAEAQTLAYETIVLRKTCRLKPDTGPCRGNILMYYFDPKKGDCNKFVWGGCQGNGNRFDSRDECYSNCLANITALAKKRPRYCNLNFDYGYCFGAIPRYYYDHLWKVCKERLYSGCGGNKNNFYSIGKCDSICRYGNGFIKAIKLKKGQMRKVVIINPPAVMTTKKSDHHIQIKKKTSAAPAAVDKT